MAGAVAFLVAAGACFYFAFWQLKDSWEAAGRRFNKVPLVVPVLLVAGAICIVVALFLFRCSRLLAA